jgi:hypothetical protein
MLYAKTPFGPIQISKTEENKLLPLTDEQLIQKALEEHENFCISPATYAMIEKRGLDRTLQRRINPQIGYVSNPYEPFL